MKIYLIAAYSTNFVIGSNGHIPWNIPEDKKRFKKLTTNQIVIMGRKTIREIIDFSGHPLPDRTTIVVSKTFDYPQSKNLIIVPTLNDAFNYAKKNFPHKKIFISGGAALYKEALPLVKKMFITEIDHIFEGDTFFPDFNKDKYKCHINKKSSFITKELENITFYFKTYKKRMFIKN